mmetsp:Transcript_31454/g.90626  ORF Transcript_31454/g.90626 Transcript_31454/m.90626 type:complete len:279 (+) Transcript_31454:628-1464(+)
MLPARSGRTCRPFQSAAAQRCNRPLRSQPPALERSTRRPSPRRRAEHCRHGHRCELHLAAALFRQIPVVCCRGRRRRPAHRCRRGRFAGPLRLSCPARRKGAPQRRRRQGPAPQTPELIERYGTCLRETSPPRLEGHPPRPRWSAPAPTPCKAPPPYSAGPRAPAEDPRAACLPSRRNRHSHQTAHFPPHAPAATARTPTSPGAPAAAAAAAAAAAPAAAARAAAPPGAAPGAAAGPAAAALADPGRAGRSRRAPAAGRRGPTPGSARGCASPLLWRG